MAGEPFRGIYPYLVTPFDPATGRVREKVLRELVQHLVGAGVQGLSPLGSTGEIVYLTFEQRREVVRIVVDAAAGRVPVLPGVAAFSTHDAVRQAQSLAELGADGLVVMLQTLFPVDRPGVEDYFRVVAESVPCPIVVYTNPGLLGGDVPPDTIDALSHVPNIRYVKDASGQTGRILTILNRAGDRMRVFSASAHIPVVVLQLGGVGWMAGPACVIPRQSVRLYDLACAGRWDEAYALQRPLWRLNELFQRYSLAACIKLALEIQGFEVGPPIAPQRPLPTSAGEEIRAALEVADALVAGWTSA